MSNYDQAQKEHRLCFFVLAFLVMFGCCLLRACKCGITGILVCSERPDGKSVPHLLANIQFPAKS